MKAINGSTEDVYRHLLIVPNDKWEFRNLGETVAWRKSHQIGHKNSENNALQVRIHFLDECDHKNPADLLRSSNSDVVMFTGRYRTNELIQMVSPDCHGTHLIE